MEVSGAMGNNIVKWTEEEIAICEKMASERCSSREIAIAIKKTRNAVIGHCRRNRVQLHKSIYEPRADKPYVEELNPSFIPRKLVKMTELKKDQCPWIIGNSDTGESKCCGKKVVKKSFCEEHARICYV